MKKIRIAQIGIGHNHAAAKMATCRKFSDVFDVVGFAENDEEWIKKRGSDSAYHGLKRYSEDEILSMNDLDAVLVETDVWNLDDTAIKCLERGFHIHMDKPPGENIKKYEHLLDIARQKNLVVQLAYMYRNNPAVKKAIEIIDSGVLGEIVSIDAMMSTDHSAEYRKWLEHFKGGSMYIFGCHLIDLIYRIMGKPHEIHPYLMKTHFDGADSHDSCFTVMRYDKAVATVRTSSVEVNGYGRRQLVICGREGTIEIKPIERPTKMYLSLRKNIYNIYSDTKQLVDCIDLAGNERYDEMMLDFASFIRKQKENPYNYEYELELQRLILEACNI